MAVRKSRLTLKALANVSPGRGPRAGSPHGGGVFALKPWVQEREQRLFATPTRRGLRLREMSCVVPGLPKRNPGLELANAFSVIHFR